MYEMGVDEVTEGVDAMSLEGPSQFGEDYEYMLQQNDRTEGSSNATTAQTTEMELFGSMFPDGWPQQNGDVHDTMSVTSEATIRPWRDLSSPSNEEDDSASTTSYTISRYIPTDQATYSLGSSDSATIASGTIGGTGSRVRNPVSFLSSTGSYIPLDEHNWLRVKSSLRHDECLIRCDDTDGNEYPITWTDMKLAARKLTIMYKCTQRMNETFKINKSSISGTSKVHGLRGEMKAWQQAYENLKTSKNDYKGLKKWLKTLTTDSQPETRSAADVVAMLIPMVEKVHATHEQAVADENCAFEKVWEHLGVRCSCEATTSAAETA